MGREWPEDMLGAAREMQNDAAVRVVLLTGEGRSFCSGVDLTQLAAGEISSEWFHRTELAYRALETLAKPVIAGVQEYCMGGGLQAIVALAAAVPADDATPCSPPADE